MDYVCLVQVYFAYWSFFSLYPVPHTRVETVSLCCTAPPVCGVCGHLVKHWTEFGPVSEGFIAARSWWINPTVTLLKSELAAWVCGLRTGGENRLSHKSAAPSALGHMEWCDWVKVKPWRARCSTRSIFKIQLSPYCSAHRQHGPEWLTALITVLITGERINKAYHKWLPPSWIHPTAI